MSRWEAIVMLVKALREPLGVGQAFDPFSEDAYEGRLAQRYAERTGLPTNGERAAMAKAMASARGRLSGARVAVFPVLVNGLPDEKQAAHLISLLNDGNLGKADLAAPPPAVQIPSGPNEQVRLWKVARAVREHLRKNPAAGDYALFTDYAMTAGGRPALAHLILCDGKGEWVAVDFQNDHAPDFQAISTVSADDCDRLVVRRLKALLAAPEGRR